MWKLSPWLQIRLALLSLAAADAATLIVLYNYFFWCEFKRVPYATGSVFAVVTIWLIISYLLGRYSTGKQANKLKQREVLLSAVYVSIIVGSAVVLADWIAHIEDPRVFRSFILPVLGLSAIATSVTQVAIRGRPKRREAWIIVGGIGEQEQISRLGVKALKESSYTSVQVLSGEDIGQHLREEITGVAISERAQLSDRSLESLLVFRGSGAEVCTLEQWIEANMNSLPPEFLTSRRLITSDGFRLRPNTFSWRLKRFGDIIASLGLMIATLPLLIVAIIAIYAEDQGSPFYKQSRTGLYGEIFTVWKLRSMRTSAESDGNAIWSTPKDPRITRMGRLLRKIRIDELPQLFNVIKGDMSLVGPRPERPEIENLLETEIEHYRIRHWVRPGLSGWAQVSYPYGASVDDSRQKTSYDFFYMKNYSILLDLLIILKTFRLVVTASGSEAIHNAKQQY